MHYIVLFLLVLIVGLIPAFGPPSWIFAIFFQHKYHLAFISVVLLTALATTIGRLLLSLATKALKNHLPKRFINNLTYTQNILRGRRKSTGILIGLFVLSPLPSAQLFEAAGLLETNLVTLGLAFFLGRLASLSIYLSLVKVIEPNIHSAWEAGLTSPWAFASEVLCLLAILVLLNMRWLISKIKR
ncbi:MAG TPA: hypothetical protein VMV24_02445 [Candidatus Dormibacteraeota bacterium]|nr:hypothetical protein [Candidatus Dormibacteraeota bacterium]